MRARGELPPWAGRHHIAIGPPIARRRWPANGHPGWVQHACDLASRAWHDFSACIHFSQSRIMRPRIHAAARRRDRRQILLGACCMKTAPNVPNKGARRGAKCASAAHEGGAPLGFQPVHTPGQTRRSSRGVGDIPDTASSYWGHICMRRSLSGYREVHAVRIYMHNDWIQIRSCMHHA